MHATDIHVSARMDRNYVALGEAGRAESQAAYNNFNDSFRDVIRYANHLHDIGALDVMIVTGDLVDYQMEKGQDTDAHGGNFLLFERIVRGWIASPSGRPVEELRVPMFTTLGNHDYRVKPYELYFGVHIAAHFDHRQAQYANQNLITKDAFVLQGNMEPAISSDEALDMVRVVRHPPYYHRRINRVGNDIGENSYTIALGRHRLVMLDSGGDTGGPQSVFDAAWGTVKPFPSEDFEASAGGSPNLRGVTDDHLDIVAGAMKDAPDGLVLIGIHGPPLNIAGSRFEDFFREAVHPTTSQIDIANYVVLAAGIAVSEPLPGQGTKEDLTIKAADLNHLWLRPFGKPHFMIKTVGDLLDMGVSKGRANDLLFLCTGGAVDQRRPTRSADLILCGHGHDAVEYRIGRQGGEIRFFMDFYVTTPEEAYGTHRPASPAGQRRVSVYLKDGATPNAMPARDTHDHRWDDDNWAIAAPPYPDTLDRSANPRGWWQAHRPLVIQSGAVGPNEDRANSRRVEGKAKPDPSFRGCRVISVAGDVICNIYTVRNVEMRPNVNRPSWERFEGAHVTVTNVWKPAVRLTAPPAPSTPSTNAPPESGGRHSQPATAPEGFRFVPIDARIFRLVYKDGRCLHIEHGALECSDAPPGWLSARWRAEAIGDNFRLRNLWKNDHCLNIENGTLACGPVQPGWLSAQWTIALA